VNIKPTIGRRVWYRDSVLSDQFCDAGICYVFSDSCVNLTVADRNGAMHARTSVVLIQGPPEECAQGQACWMPYQKAQASADSKA
jgi:hypothetical protein